MTLIFAVWFWDPLTDQLLSVWQTEPGGTAPGAGLVRQILHGDRSYDDPQLVISAGIGSTTPMRYFPVIDEAGAGSLQAVLDAEGHLVERVLYADAYGDSPRYLQGPVVDDVSLEIARSSGGELERVDLFVHLSEPLVPETIAEGVTVRSRKTEGSTQIAPCTPTQEDTATILCSIAGLDWPAFAASGDTLEIAVTSTLRAHGWNSPVQATPSWAVVLGRASTSPAEPVIVTTPFSYLETTLFPTLDNGASHSLYAIPDLYLAASPESKSKLLTDFKAAPFIEPATGLVYLRARWYDPGTGSFLTPDPSGYLDSSNLYAGFAGDPVNLSDPTGEAVESYWDALSLSIGAAQISAWDENTSGWHKTLDVAGVVVDTGALLLPGLPGGASAILRSYRAADAAQHAMQLKHGIDYAQGLNQSLNVAESYRSVREDIRTGQLGWGTGLNAIMGVAGVGSLRSRFDVRLHSLEQMGVARYGGLPFDVRSKAIFGDDVLSDAINPTSRYRAGVTSRPRHHVFPQEERGFFEERGFVGDLDIDEFTLELTESVHQALHGGGNWRLGRTWTGEWNSRIMRNLRRTEKRLGRQLVVDEIFNEGLRMMRRYRIEDVPFTSFKAPRQF